MSRALGAGAAVDGRDADGWSALMFAAAAGDAAAAKLLLRAKADPNQRTKDGQTPLFGAVFSGSADTVRALLDAGARPDSALPNGKTPVQLARERSRPDLVVMLSPAAGAVSAKADLKAAADAATVSAPKPVTLPSSAGGVSADVIRVFLQEDAQRRAQGTALQARREKLEERGREAETEKARLAQLAQQRYDGCVDKVKQCQSGCETRSTIEMLGAAAQSLAATQRGRSSTSSDQALLSAGANAESCKASCESASACDALRP